MRPPMRNGQAGMTSHPSKGVGQSMYGAAASKGVPSTVSSSGASARVIQHCTMCPFVCVACTPVNIRLVYKHTHIHGRPTSTEVLW